MCSNEDDMLNVLARALMDRRVQMNVEGGADAADPEDEDWDASVEW